MKLVVIGGHTRNIGKTSLAEGVIAASPEREWTAFKITQYGHGLCSDHGGECDCAPEEPDCPYAIDRETDPASGTDTSRFLKAGAKEAYWVRTRVGQLDAAVPELRRVIEDREFAIIESNSILRFIDPDVYLPVLGFGVEDFKLSSKLYFNRADAFAVVGQRPRNGNWPGVDLSLLESRPVFTISPPTYFSAPIAEFLDRRLR